MAQPSQGWWGSTLGTVSAYPWLLPALPSQLPNLFTLGDNIVVYKVHAQDPTTEINKTPSCFTQAYGFVRLWLGYTC